MENSKHQIKISPKFFKDVCSGIKQFELRFNDRQYKVGDLVQMMEFEKDEYSGLFVIVEITYMIENYNGLSIGYCIFGFKIITKHC